jgi:hypothetical protein
VSTLRYSGEIRIRVTYLDVAYPDTRARLGNGRYRCFLRGPGGMTTTVIVGAPAYLSRAVDSPEAFDDAAHAAISFAESDDQNTNTHEWANAAACKPEGGWHIGRSPSAAWPPGEEPSAPIDTVF